MKISSQLDPGPAYGPAHLLNYPQWNSWVARAAHQNLVWRHCHHPPAGHIPLVIHFSRRRRRRPDNSAVTLRAHFYMRTAKAYVDNSNIQIGARRRFRQLALQVALPTCFIFSTEPFTTAPDSRHRTSLEPKISILFRAASPHLAQRSPQFLVPPISTPTTILSCAMLMVNCIHKLFDLET